MTWSILKLILCHMYHIDCSMIEVSKVTERTVKPGSCEVCELFDVVLVCEDVKPNMDQKYLCILRVER
jgi:hypothetical protein